MESVYDWVTLALFAGLIVLFLQRSAAERPSDSLVYYLIAGAGLAGVNQLGNHDMHFLAILGLVVVLAFIQWRLKPLSGWKAE
jgi:hypothetical protein